MVVSRFDPQEVIPLPGLTERFAREGDALEPQQAAQVEALVTQIRRSIRLKSELRLPGSILASNGDVGAALPGDDRSGWSIDGERDPVRQESLGRNEVLMKVLCGASTLPWAQGLPPAPSDLGSVTDDALAGPVVASSTAPPVTCTVLTQPSPTDGRSGGGCSLSLTSSAGAAGLLAWLLLGCALCFARSLGTLASTEASGPLDLAAVRG